MSKEIEPLKEIAEAAIKLFDGEISVVEGNFALQEIRKKELTQAKQEAYREVLAMIVGMEATEADGWDMAEKFNCCPGDDLADAYNQALSDLRNKIKEMSDVPR